jgi:hypothetical protein
MTGQDRPPSDQAAVRRRAVGSVTRAFEELAAEIGDVDTPGRLRVSRMPAAVGAPGPGGAASRGGGAVAVALALFADVVLEALEGLADLADLVDEQSNEVITTDAGGDPLDLTGPPGGHVEARIWIHNMTQEPVIGLELRLTTLTTDGGRRISGAGSSFAPRRIDVMAAAAGQASLRLGIPCGTPPGIYHGRVLAAGPHDADLPVRLVVEPS